MAEGSLVEGRGEGIGWLGMAEHSAVSELEHGVSMLWCAASCCN